MTQIKGTTGKIAEVDPFSGHLVVIKSVHHWMHQGKFFQADYVDEALADDGTMELLVRLDAGEGGHMRFRASIGGDGRLQLFEGPTVSSAGTGLTVFNRNRRSSNAADISVYHTPTTSDDGDALSDEIIPGGGIFFSAGGKQDSFEEWILMPSTDYLLRLTNISGAAQPASISADWYEA